MAMTRENPTTVVYKKLKKQIEEGYYSPAENLPELELASEFHVSRNTIKKALLMLENDAFVTIEQNKGAKVRSYSKVEVLEFLELREELEGFLLRLAVPCFDEVSIGQLEQLLDEMAVHKANSDLMAYSQCNRQFHSVIYRVCPNRTAVDVTVRLKEQMRKYNSKTILVPGRDEQSYAEHLAILNAIKKKDAAEAEACIRQHIRNIRSTFENHYSLLF